jgi:VIT1/CCC1 family predicted Fe2+/Mn2+ transporter
MNVKTLLPVLLITLAFMPGVAAAQSKKSAAKNQLAETRSELISATEAYKESAQAVVKFQEQEVANATAKIEQLRQLVADGLIARNELAAAEQQIEAAKAKLEGTKKQIADSDNLIAQIMDAEKSEKAMAKAQAAQSRRLVQPVSMRYNGMAGWALSNISSVQAFFSGTFGRPLPISTLGQSATHNAMRWDHRNSADVGIHPDSAEGRALISFLQSKGIPFLAFRGAIPGVSTGPHIHIGYPSGRLG